MYLHSIIDSNVNSVANFFQNMINIMYKMNKGEKLDENDEYFLEEYRCDEYGKYSDNLLCTFNSIDDWVRNVERSID